MQVKDSGKAVLHVKSLQKLVGLKMSGGSLSLAWVEACGVIRLGGWWWEEMKGFSSGLLVVFGVHALQDVWSPQFRMSLHWSSLALGSGWSRS